MGIITSQQSGYWMVPSPMAANSGAQPRLVLIMVQPFSRLCWFSRRLQTVYVASVSRLYYPSSFWRWKSMVISVWIRHSVSSCWKLVHRQSIAFWKRRIPSPVKSVTGWLSRVSKSIPVRMLTEHERYSPGFMEMDLVAQCSRNLSPVPFCGHYRWQISPADGQNM